MAQVMDCLPRFGGTKLWLLSWGSASLTVSLAFSEGSQLSGCELPHGEAGVTWN